MTDEKDAPIARKDTDLESVEYGTPTKGGGKMYLNTRTDKVEDIEERIHLHAQTLERFKKAILRSQEVE